MAKKPLSIAEQIVDLEADLEQKNAELKEYEKIFDRYLKLVFGMDKKAIQKLIQERQKKVSAEPVKLSRMEIRHRRGEPPLHFNRFDAGENAAKVG